MQMKPRSRFFSIAAPSLHCHFFSAGGSVSLKDPPGQEISKVQASACDMDLFSLPPTLLLSYRHHDALYQMPEDDLGIVKGQGGLVHANPRLFIDGQASSVATAAGAIDVFAFYGLFLAALGLRKVSRLSSGSAGHCAGIVDHQVS